MTKLGILASSVLAFALAAGAASAQNNTQHDGAHPGGMSSGHGMMDMMTRMHDMMDTGAGMPGMGMMSGGGMPMMGGQRGKVMIDLLDQDGDGTVTADEARTSLDGLLSDYDSDGDGTLSISEFESLHSALIREMMVDRFQHLDADGDGEITASEMRAPADHIAAMQGMRDRMMQQGGPGSDHGMMDGEDSRMEGNNSGMQGQHGN